MGMLSLCYSSVGGFVDSAKTTSARLGRTTSADTPLLRAVAANGEEVVALITRFLVTHVVHARCACESGGCENQSVQRSGASERSIGGGSA